MKKALLIRPPFRDLTYPGNPKGPDLLKAAVRRKIPEMDVRILDLQLAGHRKQDIEKIYIEELKEYKPDLIGITNLSVQADISNRLAKIAKESDPLVIVAKGGFHESSAADWTMRLHKDCIDFCIGSDGSNTTRVEGENAFVKIAELLIKGGRKNLLDNLAVIPGAVYFEKGSLRMNPPAITSGATLNEIFAADFEHAPEYDFPIFGMRPTAHAELSRGCLMRCNFCAAAKTKPLRLRSEESIKMQLRLLKNRGFKAFYADDAALTADIGWANMVAGTLHSEGFVWGGNTRVDMVDRKTILCFGKAGCRYLFTGLESGVKGILLGMNKVQSERKAGEYLQKARMVYEWLAEAGIPSAAFLVFGGVRKEGSAYLPETFEDVKESIRFAATLEKVSFISMNFLRFLPGTRFAEDPAFACIRPTGKKTLHGGYWDEGYYQLTGENDIRQNLKTYPDVYSCFELEDGMPISTIASPEYATEIIVYALQEIDRENRRRGKNDPELQLSSAGERGKCFLKELKKRI